MGLHASLHVAPRANAMGYSAAMIDGQFRYVEAAPICTTCIPCPPCAASGVGGRLAIASPRTIQNAPLKIANAGMQ